MDIKKLVLVGVCSMCIGSYALGNDTSITDVLNRINLAQRTANNEWRSVSAQVGIGTLNFVRRCVLFVTPFLWSPRLNQNYYDAFDKALQHNETFCDYDWELEKLKGINPKNLTSDNKILLSNIVRQDEQLATARSPKRLLGGKQYYWGDRPGDYWLQSFEKDVFGKSNGDALAERIYESGL